MDTVHAPGPHLAELSECMAALQCVIEAINFLTMHGIDHLPEHTAALHAESAT